MSDDIKGSRRDHYPTPVYSFKTAAPQRDKWLQLINELAIKHPKDPATPLYRGHKIRVNLFTEPGFEDFKEMVREKALYVANDLKLDLSRMDVVLDHAWASINKKGDFNEFHSHANCDFSGTYYLKSMPSLGKLRFRDPREPVLLKNYLVLEDNIFNRDITYEPVQGQMYLFPSWLLHQVDPNPVDFERISLSFNISFVQKSNLHGTVQREL